MDKKYILIIGLILVGVIFAIRLASLQLFDNQYKISADNNAYKYVTSYPSRGLILDRNREILVENKTTYDIMVTPIELEPFDTLDFCSIFSLDINNVRDKLADYRENRRRIGYRTLTFVKQVSGEVYSIFAEKADRFVGFSAVPRMVRSYPFDAGANLFGYIGEASSDFLEKNPNYKMGDHVGITGLERSYESVLKGEKGYNIFLRDVHNRVHSRLEDGAYDVDPNPGTNLVSTIDGHLQRYAEQLMKNKVGSTIAIEPSTGEILAIVSSPGIDIDKLANINKYYNELINDPLKPMFNRATMTSSYPPGSVFKLVNGLIAFQEGLLSPHTHYSCNMGFEYGNRKMGCHHHESPLDFSESIMTSCNAYFCNVFIDILENKKYSSRAERLDKWAEMVKSFGFGQKLGSDFPSELQGNVPTSELYNKFYGKNRWNAYTILSLSIGQGELGTTPLHLANLAAILANRGHYYVPHLVKSSAGYTIDEKYRERKYTLVDKPHFDKVIDGLYMAVNEPQSEGSTAWIAAVDGLDICGKTGTAENRGEDHSIFIGFAPKDNPKIAIVTYIENAGFGGTWAAPIASLVIEKYLNGIISRQELEQKMLEANLLSKVNVVKEKKKK